MKIVGCWHPTTDGANCGRGGLIEDCFFKCDDDAVKVYDSNMVVRRCVFWQMENGSCFQHGWTGQNATGIHVYDCDVIRAEFSGDRANNSIIGSVSFAGTGGNHLYENIRVEGGRHRIVSFNQKPTSDGKLTGITIRNLTVNNWDPVVNVIDAPGLSDLTFENLRLNGRLITRPEEGNFQIKRVGGEVRFKVANELRSTRSVSPPPTGK